MKNGRFSKDRGRFSVFGEPSLAFGEPSPVFTFLRLYRLTVPLQGLRRYPRSHLPLSLPPLCSLARPPAVSPLPLSRISTAALLFCKASGGIPAPTCPYLYRRTALLQGLRRYSHSHFLLSLPPLCSLARPPAVLPPALLIFRRIRRFKAQLLKAA